MSRFLDLLAIVPGIVLPTAADIEDDPNGWLFCDGRAVSRTTYAALFTAIGTKYGAGDGSTTFNLPDLRGRVPAGRDNMGGTAANRLTTAGSGVDGVALGAAGGSETHVLTGLQMPSHSHSIRVNASGTGGSAFVETS
ncbi:MAG TPA: phage tail protein, partial [Alcanivorax sp.]|nr:phage tail protein [Alcanivorax sp.]HEX5676452.1 phage tail protein [Alcanivorax sp.]